MRARTTAGTSDTVYCGAGLYCVADGLPLGDTTLVASRLMCEVAAAHGGRFSEALSSPGGTRAGAELMQGLFDAAANRIHGLASRRSGYSGMGTSAVVLAVGPEGAVLGSVGDCRAYLLAGNAVEQLTTDHSNLPALIARGLVREEELGELDSRRFLSRAVGVQPTVAPDVAVLQLDVGQVVLLCNHALHRTFGGGNAMAGLGGPPPEGAAAILLRVEDPRPRGLSTPEKLRALQGSTLFRWLRPEEAVRLLSAVEEHSIGVGDALVREGELGDRMFLVISGRVEIRKGGTILTVLHPGDHLGEVALVDAQPRSATAIATEPTVVLSLGRDALFGMVGREPAVAARVLWSMVLHIGDRIRELTVQVGLGGSTR